MKQGILSITICPEEDMFDKLDVEQSYKDNIYAILATTNTYEIPDNEQYGIIGLDSLGACISVLTEIIPTVANLLSKSSN